MTKINQPLANEIYEAASRHEASQVPRGYLGMSSIGKPCQREPWHQWRQTSGHYMDGRILILFEFGHFVEKIICKALRQANFKLLGAYPDPQITFSDFEGFFAGHPDGIAEDDDGPMVIEIKSANTNKFKELELNGVKATYPVYYAQMQLYMYYSKLPRALFLTMKKDDCQIYSEMVTTDDQTAEEMRRKAINIITTHDDLGRLKIPQRITDDPRSEGCKWCRYTVACFASTEVCQTIRNCRSCAYLVIGPDFKPSCGHYQHKFPLKDISIACPQWSWVMQTPFTIEP